MEPIRNGLIEALFDAFSGRELPVADAYWGDTESAAVERHFNGVLPRQVSFEFVESCWCRDFIVSAMKPLTQLYYAPSFMALCIEDYERVFLEPDQILSWFRFWPFEPPRTHGDGRTGTALAKVLRRLRGGSARTHGDGRTGTALAKVLRRLRGGSARTHGDGRTGTAFPLSSRRYSPRELEHLHTWYSDGFRPEGNAYMAASTELEKRAFLLFFEFLESHRPLVYSLHGWLPDTGRALFAAKALLRGESLPRRLGATSKYECRSLLGALETLQYEYPRAFPSCATRPIVDALGRYA